MLKESDKFRSRLKRGLESVGLIYIGEECGYKKDRWMLKCLRKSGDVIQIVWHKRFTENVNKDEDTFAELVVNGTVLGMVKIDELLTTRLHNSGFTVIIEIFKSIAAQYTGKGHAS